VNGADALSRHPQLALLVVRLRPEIRIKAALAGAAHVRDQLTVIVSGEVVEPDRRRVVEGPLAVGALGADHTIETIFPD